MGAWFHCDNCKTEAPQGGTGLTEKPGTWLEVSLLEPIFRTMSDDIDRHFCSRKCVAEYYTKKGDTQPRHGWRPIETAPHHTTEWFWLVPKTAQDTYHDTSDNPIVSTVRPHAARTKYGQWGALLKALYWQPLNDPKPPTES